MADLETYPEDFFRGITSKDFVKDGVVSPEAFLFDNNESRKDGYSEASINWNDDSEALTLLLNQKKKDGSFQFKGGAVKISVPNMKMYLDDYLQNGYFKYERRRIEGNIYHGNLLTKSDITKPYRSAISAALSLLANKNLIPREDF